MAVAVGQCSLLLYCIMTTALSQFLQTKLQASGVSVGCSKGVGGVCT